MLNGKDLVFDNATQCSNASIYAKSRKSSIARTTTMKNQEGRVDTSNSTSGLTLYAISTSQFVSKRTRLMVEIQVLAKD